MKQGVKEGVKEGVKNFIINTQHHIQYHPQAESTSLRLQTLWNRGLPCRAPLVATTWARSPAFISSKLIQPAMKPTCQMQCAPTRETSVLAVATGYHALSSQLIGTGVATLGLSRLVVACRCWVSVSLRPLTVNVADLLVPIEKEIDTSIASNTTFAS